MQDTPIVRESGRGAKKIDVPSGSKRQREAAAGRKIPPEDAERPKCPISDEKGDSRRGRWLFFAELLARPPLNSAFHALRGGNMKKLIGALIGTVVAFGAAPASAAVTLNTDKNNVLLGASGVMIGSKTFRVDFVDGSCTSVFGKCAIDKFDFKTSDAVTAAISALFSQVLVGRYYANDAGKIAGCNSSICDIYIPYAFYDSNEVAAGIGANRGRRQVSGFVALDPNYSYASDSTYTFARFTLQTTPSVPEPSSWAMMLAGFAVVGYAMRSRCKVSPSIV